MYVRPDTFNTKHRTGRLFQQQVIDILAAVEKERLDFFARKQPKLRAERYYSFQDQLFRNNVETAAIGKVLIFPSSFTEGDRFIQQLFQDFMCLVTHFGKPDLFITFTANPAWEEITNVLFDGQAFSDRPNIVARVFRAKFKDLIQNIKNGQIFGECRAIIYTVEYQKRDLPHAHIIVFLNSGHAFFESD
jgi:Helitron helicase-like domain at N-terminus